MRYIKLLAAAAALLGLLSAPAHAGGFREFSSNCHIDKTRALNASAWKKYPAKNQEENHAFYFFYPADYTVDVKLPGIERLLSYKINKKLLPKDSGGFELLPDNPNIRQAILPIAGADLRQLVLRIKLNTRQQGVIKGEYIKTYDGEIEAYYSDETVHSVCLMILKY